MYPIQYSLVVHLVGVGMLFTSIFGGILLHIQYKRAADGNTKLLFLRSLRLIGLLSPLGVLVLILSGIGNMTLGPHEYTLFSDGWLSTKLMLFLIMVLAGTFFGIQGARRTGIVKRLVDGTADDAEQMTLRSLDTQQIVSYAIQFVLILAILTLSITRPHA